MPARPPDGTPAPADGSLPAAALRGADERDLGLYLHVPFCAVRCGYCDFNTYTFAELGEGGPASGAAATAPPGGPRDWLDAVLAELRLAVRVLGSAARSVSTVFIGGGTPTLLDADVLPTVLQAGCAGVGPPPGGAGTARAQPGGARTQKAGP